jgi:hypothetical protein
MNQFRTSSMIFGGSEGRARTGEGAKEWGRRAIVAFWELGDASELSANEKQGERSKGMGLGEVEGRRTLQNSHRELHPQDVLVPVVGELDPVAAQMRSRKGFGLKVNNSRRKRKVPSLRQIEISDSTKS